MKFAVLQYFFRQMFAKYLQAGIFDAFIVLLLVKHLWILWDQILRFHILGFDDVDALFYGVSEASGAREANSLAYRFEFQY